MPRLGLLALLAWFAPAIVKRALGTRAHLLRPLLVAQLEVAVVVSLALVLYLIEKHAVHLLNA